MRLEVTHPEVAYRDCNHCRKFVYDEKTGKPRESRGQLLPRVKPPPCELDGCAKGHWRRPIRLGKRGVALVQLFEASRASGGSILTEAERQDRFLLYAFSVLGQFYEERHSQLLAASVSKAMMPMMLGGSKRGA